MTDNANTYMVVTEKSWNIDEFNKQCSSLPGRWELVSDSEAFCEDIVASLAPRYIFFPHWSRRVPDAILEASECVCFHMTDVPYGRGGSPLQNLIVRGHKDTQISALRMTSHLDAGPVYLKRPLLLDGSAKEIFIRCATQVFSMIKEIVEKECVPVAQKGEPVVFPRRTPEQSVLPTDGQLENIYDHIRMLDAEGYPPAFIDHGCYRIEFDSAKLDDGVVEAIARIKIIDRG